MIARFLRCERASPSAEFALILPFIVVLLFGGFEAGNFMWTQHKLIVGVREGARFAARQPIGNWCTGTSEASGAEFTTAETRVKVITRTGLLPDAAGNDVARPRIGNWTNAMTTVSRDCDGFSSAGIYTQLGHAGPTVSVAATVPYNSLLNGLGVIDNSFTLRARSDTAVIGI